MRTLIITVLSLVFIGCGFNNSSLRKHIETAIRLEFDEAWNKGNTDVLDGHIALDFIRHSPPYPDIVGLDALKQLIKGTPNVFFSFNATIDEIICTSDRSITRFTIRAIPQGQNKEVTMTGSMVDHWKDGKTVERWTQMDYLGFMQRQGFTLSPPLETVSSKFIGSWSLVSFEQRNVDNPNAPPVYPMGKDVAGWLTYSKDGSMSVALVKENRPVFSSNDLSGGTTEEKASAFGTYITYCGTYEIQDNAVIHHIEASLFPNWSGTEQRRLYTFEGDTLTLSTPLFEMGGGESTGSEAGMEEK